MGPLDIARQLLAGLHKARQDEGVHRNCPTSEAKSAKARTAMGAAIDLVVGAVLIRTPTVLICRRECPN